MKKNFLPQLAVVILICMLSSCKQQVPESKSPDLSRYPAKVISNEEVEMKVYLPDSEKGVYRGTRFDWSGVIGSMKYKGHEYFGYWKETHDPLYHEDLTGPVEGFINPGLGYEEAEPGEGYIRIGVGVLEKEDEEEYNWMKTYPILDHGQWTVNHGEDWIKFTHQLQSNSGYGYSYSKTIRLKNNGFTLEHTLLNNGEKTIETDQFNHNFFMIDGKKSGTAFQLSFPYAISTGDDPKGYLKLEGKNLSFVRDIERGGSVFIDLEGYGKDVKDHEVTVVNRESGAGVTFTIDRPLHRLAFWACETTLSPENFIWISLSPGEEETWTSDYTLFVN